MMLYRISSATWPYEWVPVEVTPRATKAKTRAAARYSGAHEMFMEYIDTRSVLAEWRDCPQCGARYCFAKRDNADEICYDCADFETIYREVG